MDVTHRGYIHFCIYDLLLGFLFLGNDEVEDDGHNGGHHHRGGAEHGVDPAGETGAGQTAGHLGDAHAHGHRQAHDGAFPGGEAVLGDHADTGHGNGGKHGDGGSADDALGNGGEQGGDLGHRLTVTMPTFWLYVAVGRPPKKAPRTLMTP